MLRIEHDNFAVIVLAEPEGIAVDLPVVVDDVRCDAVYVALIHRAVSGVQLQQ